jgi:hypothetical protein
MSFVFSMPTTTAYVERIFSIMNNKWSSTRNKCTLESIKAELLIKLITLNFNRSCKDFYDYIKNDRCLLNQAAANGKY